MPGNASEERSRNKNGHQDQGDADDGACYLFHGLHCGVTGAETQLCHVALYVFHNYNCVVNHNSYGKNQPQQGDHVYGKSQQRHDRECAHERYRNGYGWDESSPPVLEEDEDHYKDQHESFEKSFDDFVYGGPHKQGRIVNRPVVKPSGEVFPEFVHFLCHPLCDIQSV